MSHKAISCTSNPFMYVLLITIVTCLCTHTGNGRIASKSASSHEKIVTWRVREWSVHHILCQVPRPALISIEARCVQQCWSSVPPLENQQNEKKDHSLKEQKYMPCFKIHAMHVSWGFEVRIRDKGTSREGGNTATAHHNPMRYGVLQLSLFWRMLALFLLSKSVPSHLSWRRLYVWYE